MMTVYCPCLIGIGDGHKAVPRSISVNQQPTYSSWLNQVERWFGLITQQAIRRGSFKGVRQLISSILRYVDQYNVHERPFMWTATADSILEKIARLCKAIFGTEHWYV
jgi:putative transposase